ncbi:protein tyrosine phosphatase [Basilea psittacipulmonis DSM 24701]|uniref:protein-tyrosine-phosphatase n=2 Tax=Basilea TaxID=1472344 RepID=A0A077DDJ6_9BURK|nr:protein tyrosine phosphatase [Basilea psittacipulmonis DSM 24701]
MGNICRSPSAEGILRKMVAEHGLESEIEVGSAATSDYHVGEPPDGRAQLVAKKRNIDISGHRARMITPEDFKKYDLILAMDWDNITYMQQICPRSLHHKIMLLMRFANDHEEATVSDPFYGPLEGFVKMMDYLEDACAGVFENVSKRSAQFQVD